MSKFKIAAVALAALALSPAFAGDTKDLTVTAKVVGTCQLVANATLDFGTLNQVTAGDLTPTTKVQYRCTNGTAPTGFTVGGGASPFAGAMKNAALDVINYTLTWTTPTTKGSGLGPTITPVDVVLNASLPGANYATAPAGDYSQVVAVEIAP